MTKDIRVIETVLRDGHQSLAATRMSTEQMIPILETMDQAGYYALECWGGATFDACLRYLNEDPWERLRTIRKHVKNTKLQMLLRGQNLLGYHNYPDDVVEEFVKKSIENGIDILRIFDALNDTRNMETSIKATKKYGGHAQAAICYTISDVHTIEYYTQIVKEMDALGADSICIKDMAGILTPQVAYDLVKAIKEVTDLPVDLHTHATSGTGSMTVLKAIEAGADMVDTAISPFAGGTSQPATETMHYVMEEKGYNDHLNIQLLEEISKHFSDVRDDFLSEGIINPKVLAVEPKSLIYQVPGGMLSNLLSQLTEANAAHRYNEVLEEVPRVRADLGYPPLVTPLSQMVGTQAVMNVLTGERYKLVPDEIKDYVKGRYGKPPAEITAEVRKKIIGNEAVITERPANLLEPGLEKAKQEIGETADTIEDVLSYISFPQIATHFLKKQKDPWYDVPIQEIEVIYEGTLY